MAKGRAKLAINGGHGCGRVMVVFYNADQRWNVMQESVLHLLWEQHASHWNKLNRWIPPRMAGRRGPTRKVHFHVSSFLFSGQVFNDCLCVINKTSALIDVPDTPLIRSTIGTGQWWKPNEKEKHGGIKRDCYLNHISHYPQDVWLRRKSPLGPLGLVPQNFAYKWTKCRLHNNFLYDDCYSTV